MRQITKYQFNSLNVKDVNNTEYLFKPKKSQGCADTLFFIEYYRLYSTRYYIIEYSRFYTAGRIMVVIDFSCTPASSDCF